MFDRKLLQLYHFLPGYARNMAASFRGWVLSSWRYGPETERLVYEAIERDNWSHAQWKAWREERLAKVLYRATKDVPYYRQEWARRRRKGDRSSPEYLENWPVLEKEEVRLNAAGFVAGDCEIRRMNHENTSGTTGTPLDLWVGRETSRSWYALSEARWHRWYGVNRHDRWAILGGQLVTPVAQRRPPLWVWNQPLKQLYLSVYHLAPDLTVHYLDALKHYRVRYLYGYTSALHALAEGVLRHGRHDLRMSVVISNAEPVFDYQRRVIEEAFQCPVRETYGMSEMVAAASECEKGALHLWPDAGCLEVIGEESRTKSVSGEFICTGFVNLDMPLVRYKIGDRGTLAQKGAVCGCNRTLPIIDSIDGRIDDVLFTRDGRRVGRLDPVFKAELSIREAQIIQEGFDRVRLRYIPTSRFSTKDEEYLIESLRERMGDIEVILEETAEIPRAAGGKFKAVICNIPKEQRASLGIR